MNILPVEAGGVNIFARWSGRYEHFARFWCRGTIDSMPLYAQACNATFSARLDTKNATTLQTMTISFCCLLLWIIWWHSDECRTIGLSWEKRDVTRRRGSTDNRTVSAIEGAGKIGPARFFKVAYTSVHMLFLELITFLLGRSHNPEQPICNGILI